MSGFPWSRVARRLYITWLTGAQSCVRRPHELAVKHWHAPQLYAPRRDSIGYACARTHTEAKARAHNTASAVPIVLALMKPASSVNWQTRRLPPRCKNSTMSAYHWSAAPHSGGVHCGGTEDTRHIGELANSKSPASVQNSAMTAYHWSAAPHTPVCVCRATANAMRCWRLSRTHARPSAEPAQPAP